MKVEIKSEKAPQPIGPYSQAIKHGNMLVTAGQIAIIPESGELFKGPIEEETHYVMRNLSALLEEGGFTFNQVIKCSIFLKDMNDFAAVNEVYGSYFQHPYPVRETVQVSRLPKDVNVEISLMAVRD